MLNAQSQRGFNILEAVIALAVLGILMAASLPSVASWIRATEMRGVAEALQIGIQKARTEALRRNQVVTFWLVSTPASAAAPDKDCVVSAASASWVVNLGQDSPAGLCDTAPSATEPPRIVETHGAGKAALSFGISGVRVGGGTANAVSFNGYGQALASDDRLSRIDISHPEAGQRTFSVEISPSGGVRMCDRGVAKGTGDPRACEQS